MGTWDVGEAVPRETPYELGGTIRVNSTAQTSQWLTATEAAHYLKVKPRTILKWAKEGRVPAHPLSGSQRVTWRFLRSELDAMLTLPSAAKDGRVQWAAE